MIINVLVKSNSKKGNLVQQIDDNSLIVFIRDLAFEDRANTALVKTLAEYYGVPKTSIAIKSGQKSRNKIVTIKLN